MENEFFEIEKQDSGLIQKKFLVMKFLITVLLNILLSFVTGLYLPWWGFAFATLLVSLVIPQKPIDAFTSGFLGMFLLWGGLAWWIDKNNSSILSQKIAL